MSFKKGHTPYTRNKISESLKIYHKYNPKTPQKHYCTDCGKENSGANLCWACYIKSKNRAGTCDNCNKEIIIKLNDEQAHHFCGTGCSHEYKKNNYISNKIIIKCDNCGKNIEKFPSLINKTNFCNRKCQGEYRSKNKSKHTSLARRIKCMKKHYDWKDKVFKRDNNICQHCGSTEYLHCHHIKHVRFIIGEMIRKYNHKSVNELVYIAQSYKELWDIDNGITLCYECHEEAHPELKIVYGGLNYAPSAK